MGDSHCLYTYVKTCILVTVAATSFAQNGGEG